MSAPAVSADYLAEERRRLFELGVFDRLAPTCDGRADPTVRFTNPAGQPEVLTSMTPVHIGQSCWVVITSQSTQALLDTSIGRPVWQTTTIHIAIAVYLLSAAIMAWLFLAIWRNIDRFRTAARKIRVHGAGETSFREMNTIPELAGVADDFDSLVGRAQGVAGLHRPRGRRECARAEGAARRHHPGDRTSEEGDPGLEHSGPPEPRPDRTVCRETRLAGLLDARHRAGGRRRDLPGVAADQSLIVPHPARRVLRSDAERGRQAPPIDDREGRLHLRLRRGDGVDHRESARKCGKLHQARRHGRSDACPVRTATRVSRLPTTARAFLPNACRRSSSATIPTARKCPSA